METRAISMADATAYLAKHERAYKEPAEPICAIAVGEKEVLDGTGKDRGPIFIVHGVAILGRLDDRHAALAHIYVDGTSQGYSLLYGACWRALKALGYEFAKL